MAEELIGRVGVQTRLDGDGPSIRIGRSGAVIVSQGHSRYKEISERGKLFIAQTAVTGVAPGTALDAAPPISVWNPPGSGKNLFLLETVLAYVSGTIGVGMLVYVHGAQPSAAPTTGTELTIQSGYIDGSVGSGRGFTGSTYVATGVILKAVYSLAPFLATTVTMPPMLKDIVDGMICVPPGTWFGMQAIAGSGTSPLLTYSISWEEVAIGV